MPDIFTKENVPSYKRVDGHMINPTEIRLDPELNGRVDPPTEADIQQRVDDFLNPAVGQLQPVLIAKESGYPLLVDGHIRWMAAIRITQEGRGPHEGGVFKLKCAYFTGSPLERFIATIKANIRKEPTIADNGGNISKLIHNFGLSEEDIALRVYGRTTSDGKPDVQWVRECLAFSELAPESLEALRAGILKPKAAIVLAQMAQDAQRARLTQIQESGKKLTVANIKRDTSAPEPPYTPPVRFGRVEACAVVQEFLDSDWSGLVAMDMTPENLVMTVLGDVLKKMEGK